MNNELMNKIISILNIYENNSISAKLWNIDTDIFNFLTRVSEMLKNTKKSIFKEIRIKYISKENRYKLWIDEFLVPSSKSETLARSTIRQYLQIFSSLNYIDDIKLPKNDELAVLELSFEFSNLIYLDPIPFATNIIINSIKSNVSYIKNIGFSMFVCLLFKKDKNILTNELLDNFKFEKIKTKNDGYKILPPNKRLTYIEQMHKETYINILEKFNDKEIIELINLINDYLFKYYNFYLINDLKIDLNYNEFNISNLFQSGRGLLRKKIIKNRNIKNDNYYTDIEFLNDNNIWVNLKWPIDQSEAAHIISVKDLKEWEKKISSNKEISKEKIYNNVSDYNNGLLMPEHYHKAYDKNKFFFNNDGIAIIRNEFIEEFKIMGIKKFRIKESIFNENMKENIQNR